MSERKVPKSQNHQLQASSSTDATVKENCTEPNDNDQVNLAAGRHFNSSIESTRTQASGRQTRRSLNSKRTSKKKQVNRDLMKIVKNHYYGQPQSAQTQAWVNKVLADVFKVANLNEDKNCKCKK